MSCAAIFPLEMDLSWETFEYESETSNTGKIEDDDDEVYTTSWDKSKKAGTLLDLADSAEKIPKPQGEQKDAFDLTLSIICCHIIIFSDVFLRRLWTWRALDRSFQ